MVINARKDGLIMSTNERIKEVRVAMGLTQSSFAKRIAISLSYLTEIENGNKSASERVIRLVSSEFNVDDNWIRSGEGSMLNENVDIQMSNLMSMFKSLNQQFKECALSQMEDLANLCAQIKANH